MSQEMKSKVNMDPLVKQYKQKKNLNKAIESAKKETKQTMMNDVRNLFNLQLARVYKNETHQKAVVEC